MPRLTLFECGVPPSSAAEPTSSPASHSEWFAGEVQAHEASLRNYLRGSFPHVRDSDDVVQESYLRLWKSAAAQPIRSAKAFLFTVARRLAVDRVRRERNSPLKHIGQLERLGVIDDTADVIDDVGRRERVQLLAQAIASLPERCREVFILYKVRGLSRKAAAAQLGLSEKTVESHTARAMRQCEVFFQRKGVKGGFEDVGR